MKWAENRATGLSRASRIGWLAALAALAALALGGGSGQPAKPALSASFRPAVKILCIERGIYRVTGQALKDNGVNLSLFDPARMILLHE